MQKPTAEELAERERRIYQTARDSKQSPAELIAADRIERWNAIIPEIAIPDEIHPWKEAMQKKHGPSVLVHGMTLGWITALVVVRYGQAEYFWPDALTPDDLKRARRWLAGETPEGVRYIELPKTI